MRNLLKNQTVTNALPSLTNAGYKHAYLVTEGSENIPQQKGNIKTPNTNKQKLQTGKPVFEFLYNPESMSFSIPITYAETPIPFTSVPQVQYVSGGSQTLTISDVYLDTVDDSRSLQPILDSLVKLREPSLVNGFLKQPPVLYFKWGKYQSFPCVLSQVDYQVTNRIDGMPVRAKLNLVLKEVPAKNKRVASESIAKAVAPTNNKKKLTSKQSIDAKETVQRTLQSDLVFKTLPKSIQEKIKGKKVKISIDDHTGEVKIKNNNGSDLFTLGTYNGDILQLNQKVINKNFKLNN